MKKRWLHIMFSLLLFIFVPLRESAQEINFDKVKLPKGIKYIGNVAQDKSGYLWIASKGLGLIRFDGYEYKTYLNEPGNLNSLAENQLEKIFIDSKGLIWIATWTKGLDRFDPATGIFTHFRPMPGDTASLSHDLVRAIWEDHEGKLWIGTAGGLDLFDPQNENFKHHRYDRNDPGSLSCDRVRTIFEDRSGTLWIGTGSTWSETDEVSKDEGGLNRFDRKTGKFTRYLYDPLNPQKLVNNKVQAIFEDSEGIFWVGTAGDGLHTLDRNTGLFQRYPFTPSQPERLSRPKVNSNPFTDYITFINEDAIGRIWIGTLGNGGSIYDKKTGKCLPYKLDFGKESEAPGSMTMSRDSMVWISGWLGSLYKINPFYKNIPQFDLGARVNVITKEPSNVLWLGTDEGLIRKDIISGDIITYTHDPLNSNSLSGNIIWSISKDKSGIMWIGTDKGLDRFDPNTNQFSLVYKSTKEPFIGIFSGVFSQASVGQDSLWIFEFSEFSKFNTKKNTVTPYRYESLDSNLSYTKYIRNVQVDNYGKIWICTFLKGLIFFDPVSGNSRRFLGNIPSTDKIFQDSNGTIWVSSDEGIFFKKTNDYDFSRFIDASARALNGYSGFVEDNRKNLYINGISGVCRINLNNFETVNFEVTRDEARIDDNNQLTNFFSAAYWDENGIIYFGTGNGYFEFSPGNMNLNPVPPQIIISSLKVNGKSLYADSNLMALTAQNNSEIFLTYDQNNIIIEFAGIHFGGPENNQHLYKLENYDEDWHTVLKDKIAMFSNLPPGDYIFRIKAANSDGLWSEKNLKIIISSPWWKTWWAYLLYISVFVVGTIMFDRIQRKRIIAKERERNRERELAQAKEIEKAYAALKNTQSQLVHAEKMASLGELTAGIAHEIQNPLNFVNNFSDVNKELLAEMKAELESGNIEMAKSIANDIITNEEKIKYHGIKADAIVKSMLQHSKSSSGQKEPTDINGLVDEYLKLAYHGMRSKDKNFNVIIKSDFDPNLKTVDIIPQDIGRVLLNLYNNAFFAVSQKNHVGNDYVPTVSVSTKRIENKVEIKVKDNGSGIATNIQSKIFQPFFTTKPTGQGTGLGLSLSYDIVKAHGGEMKLDSIEGEGALFTVILPVNDLK